MFLLLSFCCWVRYFLKGYIDFIQSLQEDISSRGWGEGVVRVNETGVTWGVIVVRMFEPVFRNLPQSYTWPMKNVPIHILDRLKC